MPAARSALSLALAIALAACGASQGTPVVPDGWQQHESVELGYVMSHPADWDVAFEELTTDDVYTGPDGAEIRVSRWAFDEGWSADRILQAAEDDAAQRFGTPPVVVNELTVADGSRVMIFANSYTDDRGAFLFQRAAVLLAPTDMWYVDWYSDIGDEGGDRQRLVDFVRSFVPAPDLGDAQGA